MTSEERAERIRKAHEHVLNAIHEISAARMLLWEVKGQDVSPELAEIRKRLDVMIAEWDRRMSP